MFTSKVRTDASKLLQ